MKKTILVTGSCGLIGSQTARFFAQKGFRVIGVDNNLREYFFGPGSGTKWNQEVLEGELGENYEHVNADIRDKTSIEELFVSHRFDLIVHTAAQPSHDWAAKEPFTDFEVNALGTMVLLENFRRYCPEAVFIFTSTNKVYGDEPNRLELEQTPTRWRVKPGTRFENGIDETMSIDNSTHSLFGVSKASADLMVQEYGRYFGLKTACFRGGCLTGPHHSGAMLHGFLSWFVKCAVTGTPYTIIGHEGKQVRDNIHSFDLVNAFWHFYKNPRCAEVYNIGGGMQSNISILEAIEKTKAITGKNIITVYEPQARTGDHIWYISDLAKFKSHYPGWDITIGIDEILEQICEFEQGKSS